MSGIQTVCPLHVGAEQVSALYDGDLDAPAAAALREHLATCDVCQQRLDSYAHIAATLRAQTAPQPDARLRQGIHSARERGAGVSRVGAAWRAVAVAAAIMLIVGSFAGVLLRQARSQHPIAASSGPTVVARFPTPPTELPPPGWRTLLPGRSFSIGGASGLAVSRARPGRLVGCSISGPFGALVSDQTLDISDDGGQTWRTSPIPNLQWANNCIVLVDQVHPDTFVVSSDMGDASDPAGTGQFEVTTDAGRTWSTLAVPTTGLFELNSFPFPTLVDGHLIGIVHFNVAGEQALGDLSLDGKLTILDSTLPYPDIASSQNGIMDLAVDPTNAAHISVVAQGKRDPAHPSSDNYLYTTNDAGKTWHETHDFAFGERIHLWAPTPDALYFWVESPEQSPSGNPLQVSADGGVAWRAVTPASLKIDSLWFGPDGQIVLLGADSTHLSARLEELDPTTGKLTSLGVFPPASAGHTAIITGGADPQFIVADAYTTFARPLP